MQPLKLINRNYDICAQKCSFVMVIHIVACILETVSPELEFNIYVNDCDDDSDFVVCVMMTPHEWS